MMTINPKMKMMSSLKKWRQPLHNVFIGQLLIIISFLCKVTACSEILCARRSMVKNTAKHHIWPLYMRLFFMCFSRLQIIGWWLVQGPSDKGSNKHSSTSASTRSARGREDSNAGSCLSGILLCTAAILFSSATLWYSSASVFGAKYVILFHCTWLVKRVCCAVF